MKQKGKTWYTASGDPTLAKYVPRHQQIHEKLGQKVASYLTELSKKMSDIKAECVELSKEAYLNQEDRNASTRRFSWYTFDREFRIEFDTQEQHIRLYKATIPNPSSKDYELVNTDFNKSLPVETKEWNETMEQAEQSVDEKIRKYPLTQNECFPSNDTPVSVSQTDENHSSILFGQEDQ